MVNPFDRSKFIGDLEKAHNEIRHAAGLGTKLGKQPFKRLFLVACGAPNAAMSVIEYWVQKISIDLEVRRYFPITLLHQDPSSLDQDTLVILGSHSGTTAETVQAAKYLQPKACTTLSITQNLDSPIAKNSDHVLQYGKGNQGYYAAFILLLGFASAFLKEKENWDLHAKVLTSLKAFPENLSDTFESEDTNAAEVARRLKDESVIYIVGSGPVFCTAYVIASCILMEMQQLHADPLVAAEFFHGPFEVVNLPGASEGKLFNFISRACPPDSYRGDSKEKANRGLTQPYAGLADHSPPAASSGVPWLFPMDENSALILLLGEDPSRTEAERVANFCKKYCPQSILYDSIDYPMNGIEKEIRPILAPFILDAALYRVAEHLASLRSHPLTLRRYMGKVEY